MGPRKNFVQTVESKGTETEYSAEIVAETVYVNCSEGSHKHGSSKVKLIDRTDYLWEFRYYHGKLVAAHIGGKIIAYAIKGKDGGMVRVTNLETEKRAIIKNLKDDIKDIAFSFSRSEIILGIIDCEGNILIYNIHDSPQEITTSLLLHIFHHQQKNVNKNKYRLIWCPYLPSYDEEDSSDEPEKMFAVLNGTKAEIYNVGIMNEKYGTDPIDTDDSYEGYIEINHTADLEDAAFSMDGAAIAIVCGDGFVKFFQLYMVDEEKQKCLHEWRPHDGKPLSSIIFVDNILEFSSECWKFTITGANHNSEIKLWSCESWTCLQTIHFNMEPSSLIMNVYLNISIDYTGQYLVLSDINNCVLYVLQLKRNDAEKLVYVTTISQFLVPSPFLSYHILEAGVRRFSNTSDFYNDEDDEEDIEEEEMHLKLLAIQPKKFQECNINFQPESLLANAVSTVKEEKKGKEIVPNLDDLQSSVTLLIQQQTSKSLMTPEDFSGAKSASRPASNMLKEEKEPVNDMENLIDFQQLQKETFASGGSSPSREVQEILAINNSSFTDNEYFDTLNNIEENTNGNAVVEDNLSNLVAWPKIPVLKDEVDNNANEDNLKELLDDSKANKELFTSVSNRISMLESVISEQNKLLLKLQQELKVAQQSQQNRDAVLNDLEILLSKHHIQFAKMMDGLMNMIKTNERALHEKISMSLTQEVAQKVQILVNHEMKMAVSAISTLIEQYKQQTDVQYSQKWAKTDILLMENVTRALNSQSLAESLSLSVVNIVAPSLEKCYKDIIASSLVPSWEKICGAMFQQINETFTRGTKEYTASVENYMDRQRRVQEKGKDLIVQMQAVSDSLKSNSDKIANTLTLEINKQFNSALKTLQDKLSANIREVVKEQVKQSFKSHASMLEDSVMNAVRSRAVTPSPHVDTQVTLTQIQQHLSRGNYDEAFQLALSAENLQLVIYVCEKADINVILGERCMLQQSCLLALIQQLSMDFSKNTDLKLSYIKSAIIFLNVDDAQTKHFVPKVLKELVRQIGLFLQANPKPKQLSEIKLLDMAVKNMLALLKQ